mmetsp:Transcript_12553/g.18812  ORF Transcript_12553/g.18812 Transcript_12553/m.18812 type:complete len:86 (+) Transcript_12553:105-362(+)
MGQFTKKFYESANPEWRRSFLNYKKLNQILTKYKDYRKEERQVVMVTISTLACVLSFPPDSGEMDHLGLRTLREQFQYVNRVITE